MPRRVIHRVGETEINEKTVEYCIKILQFFGRILHLDAAAAQQSAQNQDTVGD